MNANKGIPRNKKPLKNILIKVRVLPLETVKESSREEFREKYGLNEDSFLEILFKHHGSSNYSRDFEFTIDDLKRKVSGRSWQKFKKKVSQGEKQYTFTIQRRVDGRNIEK